MAPMGLRSDCKIAYSMIPYQFGLEIECSPVRECPPMFKNKGCLDESVSSREARFRIIPGADGMKTLFELCNHLKEHYHPNPQGALHIHVDSREKGFIGGFFTGNDYSKKLSDKDFCESILSKLDDVGYIRSYNSRLVTYVTSAATWVRFQDTKQTIEYRIFDVSFEYEDLVKSVIKAQKVTKFIKSQIASKSKYINFSQTK